MEGKSHLKSGSAPPMSLAERHAQLSESTNRNVVSNTASAPRQ